LVSFAEGTPDVVFFHPSEVGIAMQQELPFGTLQHVLSRLFVGRSVAIGFMNGAEVVLAPSSTETITWTSEHRIITITRSTRRRASLFKASNLNMKR
jgi:hypothetical protein